MAAGGMVWHGMVWDDMGWDGMVWDATAHYSLLTITASANFRVPFVRNDARVDDKGAGRGPTYPHDQPKHALTITRIHLHGPLDLVPSASAQRSERGGVPSLLKKALAKCVSK